MNKHQPAERTTFRASDVSPSGRLAPEGSEERRYNFMIVVLITVALVISSLLGVILTSCDNLTGGWTDPAAATARSLDALVAAPVKDAAPATAAINAAQYTGTIAWQTSAGAAHSCAFA